MYKNIIFDLDDTLLVCSQYYNECKNAFIKDAHKRTGIKETIIENILQVIDSACMELEDGFGKERFPRSFAATSVVLDVIHGSMIDELASNQAFFTGDSVFSADYPMFDGIYEMLEKYKKAGFNLFLYTKGDYNVQRRKVDKNKLNDIFPEENIYIVGKKNGAQVERILSDHDLARHETVIVGDSIRDDIRSAHEAHVKSIHVWDTRQQWHYDKNGGYFPTHTLRYTTQLEKIIPLTFLEKAKYAKMV